jgi:hypothetical protein
MSTIGDYLGLLRSTLGLFETHFDLFKGTIWDLFRSTIWDYLGFLWVYYRKLSQTLEVYYMRPLETPLGIL